MSIAEFSTALRNKAIKEWFASEKASSGSDLSFKDRRASQQAYSAANVNVLINPTSDYRSAEQTAAKTSFLITKDTISAILTSLKGMDPNDPVTTAAAEKYFAEFRKQGRGIGVNRRKITVGKNIPAIFFNSISFDGITTLVNNILDLKPGELAKEFEKGHVVGINTELLQVTRDRISSVNTAGATGKAKFLEELDKVIEYYKRLDYDSANLQPADDIKVYASVDKTLSKTGKTKYLVELQPKSANQRSADEVKATIGSIRKLFTPGALAEAQLVKTIDKLREVVSDEKFKADLLNLKSSPNFRELLTKVVTDTIATGKTPEFNYSHKNVLVATNKVPKADLSQVRKIAKAERKKVEDLKKKLQIQVPIQETNFSIVDLEILLRMRLPEQVAKNMGTGRERNVLNYRTGRFAESTEVDHITVSRAGLVSVFYNYMKNPYATFSEGGKQQYPRSRDPKLLISKSIKELAAGMMFTRLRSVLV